MDIEHRTAPGSDDLFAELFEGWTVPGTRCDLFDVPLTREQLMGRPVRTD